MDIDAFHLTLDELMEEIPDDILRDLNGGVIVLPEAKLHPASIANDLYTMGEYRVEIPGMGRYVSIYYGSFERVFGKGLRVGRGRIKEELRKTLRHELRHHLESLAGERDLEIEDDYSIEAYFLSHRQRRTRLAADGGMDSDGDAGDSGANGNERA